MKIRAVFHITKLKQYVETPNELAQQKQPLPPSIIADRESEWEIDEILDKRVHNKRTGYLIK
jgi:hypothetical protein